MIYYLLQYFYRTGFHTYDLSRTVPPNKYKDHQDTMLIYAADFEQAKQILHNYLLRDSGHDFYKGTQWETKMSTVIIINKTIN